jgi:hypothetical protein
MIIPDVLEMGTWRQTRPAVASSKQSMGRCRASETLFPWVMASGTSGKVTRNILSPLSRIWRKDGQVVKSSRSDLPGCLTLKSLTGR